MSRAIREILARYGQTVTVRTAGSETVTRAFLQPLAQRSEERSVTALGLADRRLWQYLGLTALAPGDSVAWNGEAFRVRSSRPYYIGETLNHWWASLEREREQA